VKKIIFVNIVIIRLLLADSVNAQNADIDLLRNFNNESTKGDQFFRFTSDATAPIGIAVPVTMFTVSLINKDKVLQRNSFRSASTLVISSLFSTGLKYTIKRKRPYEQYPDIIQKHHVGTFSFPSGHTSFAFATATSLSLSFPKWYVIAPSFAYAGLVAYGRMHLGVHFPTDILGGMIIGIGSGFLTWQLDKWIFKP
jgi:membrane-associated phospholipid phosphatase